MPTTLLQHLLTHGAPPPREITRVSRHDLTGTRPKASRHRAPEISASSRDARGAGFMSRPERARALIASRLVS